VRLSGKHIVLTVMKEQAMIDEKQFTDADGSKISIVQDAPFQRQAPHFASSLRK